MDIVDKNKILKLAILIALVSGFLEDFVAVRPIGMWVSLFYCILLLAISIKKFKIGFELLFISFALTPTFYRDVVSDYSRLEAHYFFTPQSFTVGGFSLLLYDLVFLFIIGLFAIKKLHIRREAIKVVIFPILLSLVLLISFVGNITRGGDFYIRNGLSDYKFPIILLFSILISFAYIGKFRNSVNFEKRFLNILLLIGYSVGLRTVFFILHDILSNSPKLGWHSNMVIIAPLFFYLLYDKRYNLKKWEILLLILGMIPNGRGPIISFLVCYLVYFLVKVFYGKSFSPIYYSIIGFSIIIFSYIIILPQVNKPLYNFISFKMLFFKNISNGELSASPKVRVIEFYNINKENQDNGIFGILFGKGPGGYFTYRNYPINIALGSSDYSEKELKTGKFTNPHTFVNYFYLKSGILGLSIYILIYMYMFYHTYLKRKIKTNLLLFPFVIFYAPIGLLNSNWRIGLIFITGFLLAAITYKRDEEEHMVYLDSSL